MAESVEQARNIIQLQSGSSWNNSVITYSFLDSVPYYYTGERFTAINEENYNSTPFTSEQKNQILSAINQIESVTGLTFVEVAQTEVSVGQITYGFSDGFPEPGVNFSYDHPDVRGDVWFNEDFAGRDSLIGALHETLHAVGVQHPVQRSLADTPPFFESEPTQQYTSLSVPRNRNNNLESEDSLQLYDIGVLQHLYGTNIQSNSGSETYGDLGINYSIWDSAGASDTLSAFGTSRDATIDLRQGYFSSINHDENISIAFGAEIENAIGSRHNDTLVGNALSNKLVGGEGNDILFSDEATLLGATNAKGGEDPDGSFMVSRPGIYHLSGQDNLSEAADSLIGGDGDDTYYANHNTTVEDSDGKGAVYLDSVLLDGHSCGGNDCIYVAT